MAVDYFLKIDGIAGESVDVKHKNEIQLEAFTWGAMNDPGPGMGFGGGGGAGKVRLQDFSLATFTARRAGKAQQEFLVYKFTDVLVSSYQTSGTDDVIPLDQISIAFGKVEMEYKAQKADGSLDAGISAGWDVVQNKSA